MAFTRLEYEKSWTSPEDFPTYEDSETQVRADLQYHPDVIRNYLNGVLLATLESSQGAANIGSAGGALQEVLNVYLRRFDRVDGDIQTIAAGGVPSVSQCVRVPFTAADWEQEGEGWALRVEQDANRRRGTAFGYNLWQSSGGALCSDTWGVLATSVTTPQEEDGSIRLSAPEPYDGEICFFGV